MHRLGQCCFPICLLPSLICRLFSGDYQDEWVISRVFQKSGGATSSSSAKKGRCNNSINLYPEASSPSSVSLPPLFDPTATSATAASTATLNDRDCCSYDSHAQTEHVSCFSTIAAAASAAANQNNLDFAPPPLPPADPFGCFPRNLGVSAFPSLRSLQENLQLPLFFSSPSQAAPTPYNGGGATAMNWLAGSDDGSVNGGGGGGGRAAAGPTELDCMWTY